MASPHGILYASISATCWRCAGLIPAPGIPKSPPLRAGHYCTLLWSTPVGFQASEKEVSLTPAADMQILYARRRCPCPCPSPLLFPPFGGTASCTHFFPVTRRLCTWNGPSSEKNKRCIRATATRASPDMLRILRAHHRTPLLRHCTYSAAHTPKARPWVTRSRFSPPNFVRKQAAVACGAHACKIRQRGMSSGRGRTELYSTKSWKRFSQGRKRPRHGSRLRRRLTNSALRTLVCIMEGLIDDVQKSVLTALQANGQSMLVEAS